MADPPSASLDIGWDEGALSDGRRWRAEAWAQDQVTMLTFILPARGLNTFAKENFERIFVGEGLLSFASENRFVSPALGSDASGHLVTFVNVVVADEDTTYAIDSLALKPYS